MFGKHRTQVLVVGAGPVGLFTALALKQRGVDVELIDEAWRPGAHSYGLALHPHSLMLFDQLGLSDEILRRSYRVERVQLMAGGESKAELNYGVLRGNHPYLTILPQDALEELLATRLQKLGVPVRWNHRLNWVESSAKHVTAAVDELSKVSGGYAISGTEWLIERTRKTQAEFVIGADGHRSIVRRDMGLDHRLIGESEFYAVFEFDCPPPYPNEARMCLDDPFASILWPLPGNRCRWSFQIRQAYDGAAESRVKERIGIRIGSDLFPYLSEKDLRGYLQSRAPWFAGEIGEIPWSLIVRFERRLVDSFGKDRMWLIGDAAHMTGPAGAQSMNIGFREGFELAERVASILRHESGYGDLREFDLARRAEWRWLLGLEAGFDVGAHANPWLARNAARLLACIPASGEDLAQLVEPLGLAVHGPHLLAGPKA